MAKSNPYPNLIVFCRSKPPSHSRRLAVHLHNHRSSSTSPFTVAGPSLSPPSPDTVVSNRTITSIPLNKVLRLLPNGLVIFDSSCKDRIVFMACIMVEFAEASLNFTLRSRGSVVLFSSGSDRSHDI